MAEVPSTRSLQLGVLVPGFLLPDAEGKKYALADVRGSHGIVIAFLCNHCPFVIHLADQLGEFANECHTLGVGFAGINSNDSLRYPADSPALMKQMSAKSGWSFPYLVDEDQSVAQAYSAACTPDFYLFDAGLKLYYCGQFDSTRPGKNMLVTGDDLRRAVSGMMQGDPPPGVQRPSSGCSIKWKPGREPA